MSVMKERMVNVYRKFAEELLGEENIDLTELTINLISKSIAAIQVPGAVVTDIEQITEFLRESDRQVFTKIRDHVIGLTQEAQIKPLNVECTECNHKYTQELNMDMSSFFDSAS